MGKINNLGGTLMLKKNIIYLVMVLAPLIGIIVFTYVSIDDNLKDIELHSTYEKFDYKELKKEALVIALIKVQDDLTPDNSTILSNGNTSDIAGFYGTRSVKVIKYFKNRINTSKNLSIIEPSIITEKNEYIRTEGYEKMEKNKHYIVFLSNDNASNKLSLLSANNGKIDISSLKKNEYSDIASKTMEEFKPENFLK